MLRTCVKEIFFQGQNCEGMLLQALKFTTKFEGVPVWILNLCYMRFRLWKEDNLYGDQNFLPIIQDPQNWQPRTLHYLWHCY